MTSIAKKTASKAASEVDDGFIPDGPAERLGQTICSTLFTVAQPFGQTHKLFDARQWMRVKLRLETAGPVTVGTNAHLETAIGSGAGSSLGVDELVIVLKKGDTLYYIANATNRVRIIREPIPWQEQLLIRVGSVFDAIRSLASGGVTAATPQPTTMSQAPGAPKTPLPPGCKPRYTR